MAKKPTYEELEERVKELEKETFDRKQAERLLRKRGQKLEELLSVSPVVIYRCEPKDNFPATFITENIRNQLGYEPHEFTERSDFWASHIHPDDAPHILTNLTNLFERGYHTHEYRFLHKDGTYRWVYDELRLIYDVDGKPTDIVGNWMDITDRKQAEEALRDSEERYRTLFHDLADPVFIFRDEEPNTIRDCNKAIVEKYGYSREEVLKMIPQDFHPLDELEGVIKNIQSEEYLPHEYIHIGKDGKKYFVEVHSRKIKFKGEDAQLSIIRDITERKQAEEERKKLEAQLQQAHKMETIGILAGGVAHDLNNILSGIISYPELLLLDLPEDSPLRKPLLTIKSSGEKAAIVVQDLLTLARRGVTTEEIVNLNSIISEQLKGPEFEKLKSFHPNVDIKTNLEKDLLNIKGSTAHLSKTVFNLISNAAEAIPDGGKVLISTENLYIDRPIKGYDHVAEGDYVTVTVYDTGIGISKEDMKRIFEPFYTKKVMGRSGSGLGMSVVWGTVKDHNGYIDVESTKEKGTTFTLYFPVTREELAIDKSHILIEDYMGKDESILIVDDVEEQREIASVMLKKLGYSVTSVSSGEEAIEYMKDNSVDLLILDMIMDPGIDGLETYKRILKLHPKQKAIIASGFSETDRVKEAKRLGAGAYVKKPYVMEKIGLAIKEELEK